MPPTAVHDTAVSDTAVNDTAVPRISNHRWPEVDALRGLAVLAMVQFHVLDAYGSRATRQSAYGVVGEIVGGGAAPIFVTLAGLSAVLAARRGGASRVASRALWVALLAVLFRVQEWALGGDGSHSHLLMRVDVLNCLAAAMLFVAAVLQVSGRLRLSARLQSLVFLTLAGLIAVLTPWLGRLVQTSLASSPPFSNVVLDSLALYVHGPRDLSMFPLFPWLAMAFVGAAVGTLGSQATTASASNGQRYRVYALFVPLFLALWAVRATAFCPPQLRLRDNDNPLFLFERCTAVVALLGVLAGSAGVVGARLRASLDWLSAHSLVIYWIHVELVYGLWMHGLKAKQLPEVVAMMSLAMVVLSSAITRAWLVHGWPRLRSVLVAFETSSETLSERLLQERG